MVATLNLQYQLQLDNHKNLVAKLESKPEACYIPL